MRYVYLTKAFFLCLGLVLFQAAPAVAKEYFVAPQGAGGTAKPDGSRAAPFATVRTALRSGQVAGGDRLILLEGHHGSLYIGKVTFRPALEIVAETPGKAHVNSLRVETSRGLHFRGLGVWPLSPPEKPRPLVSTAHNARDIRFEQMDIRGRQDAPQTYLRWRKQDWLKTWRSSGVVLGGLENRIVNSTITGIAFGITLQGEGSLAGGNVIRGFSGDGIRILGDRSAAIRNRIENCVKVNANHDDGIQSWAPKKQPAKTRMVSGLLLDGNVILEWTANPGHPLRCQLQGIGFFDGFFDRVVIQNNLVVVDQYHGITLYGARRSRVVNNTVVHIDTPGRRSPWIKLENHKSGAPARDNIIANNIAMGYVNKSADTGALKKRTNAVVQYPYRIFRDPGRFDFRPKPESGYRDAGDARFAPKHDITGTPRPQGAAPDLGAFEQK